jgi:hypothetical protein
MSWLTWPGNGPQQQTGPQALTINAPQLSGFRSTARAAPNTTAIQIDSIVFVDLCGI